MGLAYDIFGRPNWPTKNQSVSRECELHLLKTRDVVHFGAIIDDTKKIINPPNGFDSSKFNLANLGEEF